MRRSLVIGFGPLDENETTKGANESFTSILCKMVAVGLLHHHKIIHILLFLIKVSDNCNFTEMIHYLVVLIKVKTFAPSSRVR